MRRWGTVDLLDILNEADHLVGFTDEFRSVATREAPPPEVLRRRLLLVLFALGTNVGIARVATGDHGETEAALRHVRRLLRHRRQPARGDRRRWSTPPSPPATRTCGATARACASDSKKFGSWDSNLMTEWHARYRRARA